MRLDGLSDDRLSLVASRGERAGGETEHGGDGQRGQQGAAHMLSFGLGHIHTLASCQLAPTSCGYYAWPLPAGNAVVVGRSRWPEISAGRNVCPTSSNGWPIRFGAGLQSLGFELRVANLEK